MSKKEPESKKALAVLALPICIALGICVGLIFGATAGSISMGICFGVMGGAVVGMISFGVLYSILNKNDKEEK